MKCTRAYWGEEVSDWEMRVVLIFVFAAAVALPGFAQPALLAIDGVDSLYVMGHARKNDIRAHYTSQRYLLEYGHKKSGTISSGRFTNVSDLLGGGFTYKFLDLDLTFSLPSSHIMETGVQNLQQFRLSGSYSSRRWTIRGYWLQSMGLVAADASGQFVSGPSIDMLSLGFPITYYFNYRKYSYKAATFLNEVQRRSAGSMLLRIEPFYRRLGVGKSIPPDSLDVATTYGEQSGLKYAYAPGVVVMPGYGYNFTTSDGRWFVAPVVFVGGGVAVNTFRGKTGEKTTVNMEYKAAAMLNAGYNGRRWYAFLRSSIDADYFILNPSFFLTTDIKLGITVGYRFNNFESFLPQSLF